MVPFLYYNQTLQRFLIIDLLSYGSLSRQGLHYEYLSYAVPLYLQLWADFLSGFLFPFM